MIESLRCKRRDFWPSRGARRPVEPAALLADERHLPKFDHSLTTRESTGTTLRSMKCTRT